MHSTAEYCAPVWCRSAHSRFIDPATNDPWQIVIGCLRPTPADNVPILAGIVPAELRRNGTTLSLARSAMEQGHRLHSVLIRPSSANAQCRKSRHPFVPAAHHFISLSDNNNIRPAQWADRQWDAEWTDNPTRLRIFIFDTDTQPPERPSPEEPRSGVTASAPMSDVSSPACSNGVWPCLQPMSVAQKNKPSTMLSCNVQSNALPMDCMAWRFWT